MKRKRLVSVMLSVVVAFAAAVVVMPTSTKAESTGKVSMYRLYNPNSGEHFYTQSLSERNDLKTAGWKDEGEGWTAPETSNTPVYRLYNPNAGEHHYTTAKTEHDNLVSLGWRSEGIGWYSDDAKAVPLYREYNPNAATGTHNYTTSKSEHDYLVSLGWKDEGIGWYGVTPASSKYTPGDIITLGTYEQDNNLSNGAEPIEWIVVGERDGHTLILSKDAIDYKKYNEELYKDITWEDCTLRSWLNNDFYNNAFSASDKGRIATAHNENPDTYELYKDYHRNNQTWGAKGGNATDDNVFLLSWTEARDYFEGKLSDYDLGAENYNQKLLCRPTAYTKAQGISTCSSSDNEKYFHRPSDVVGCCGWWLRSPGPDQSGVSASNVGYDGSLGRGGDNPDYPANGVRPALLID